MVELPSGTVTFIFTDIEGSTRLWEAHPEAMRGALARHDEILLGAIDALRADIGVPCPPYESILFEDTLRDAEAALGKERFGSAWQRGQAMGMVEALATAIRVTGG